MKTHKRLFIILMTLCTLTSCIESDDMLTVINPDGSCYKEFSNSTGSDFMLGENSTEQTYFPVIVDSSWTVTWTLEDSTQISSEFPLRKTALDSIKAMMPDEIDAKTQKTQKKRPIFDVLIRRHFKSVEDMANSFRLNPLHKWSKIKVDYHLEKKFRWFYTYYTYTETYPKIDTKFKTPVDSFMTKEQAAYWFTGEPNIFKGMNGIEVREAIGELENKYNRWFAKNMWDNEFEVLLAHYDLMKNPPVSLDSLAKCIDPLFNSKVKDDMDYKMENVLNGYFKTKAFSVYWETKESPLKKFEKEFEEQDFVGLFTKTFNYKLCMPGRMTSKENFVLNGDTLSWKLTAERMLYDDYVIKAESRKANIWAFIVSGLVLALAIGSFWYKPKR